MGSKEGESGVGRRASEASEFARVAAAMQRPNAVFVFGSNEAGKHGRGAALQAAVRWGARWGLGEGPSGRSYGIPTKDAAIRTLPLGEVEWYVQRFIAHAQFNPEYLFVVTRIGCGLAGYTDADIAPMFASAPDNCLLPEGWRAAPTPDQPASPTTPRGTHGDGVIGA